MWLGKIGTVEKLCVESRSRPFVLCFRLRYASSQLLTNHLAPLTPSSDTSTEKGPRDAHRHGPLRSPTLDLPSLAHGRVRQGIRPPPPARPTPV